MTSSVNSFFGFFQNGEIWNYSPPPFPLVIQFIKLSRDKGHTRLSDEILIHVQQQQQPVQTGSNGTAHGNRDTALGVQLNLQLVLNYL
jgi:hypothetical protein